MLYLWCRKFCLILITKPSTSPSFPSTSFLLYRWFYSTCYVLCDIKHAKRVLWIAVIFSFYHHKFSFRLMSVESSGMCSGQGRTAATWLNPWRTQYYPALLSKYIFCVILKGTPRKMFFSPFFAFAESKTNLPSSTFFPSIPPPLIFRLLLLHSLSFYTLAYNTHICIEVPTNWELKTKSLSFYFFIFCNTYQNFTLTFFLSFRCLDAGFLCVWRRVPRRYLGKLQYVAIDRHYSIFEPA